MSSWPFKVLIDGECPLCKREGRILAWLDRGRNRLVIEDITAADFDPKGYGVTPRATQPPHAESNILSVLEHPREDAGGLSSLWHAEPRVELRDDPAGDFLHAARTVTKLAQQGAAFDHVTEAKPAEVEHGGHSSVRILREVHGRTYEMELGRTARRVEPAPRLPIYPNPARTGDPPSSRQAERVRSWFQAASRAKLGAGSMRARASVRRPCRGNRSRGRPASGVRHCPEHPGGQSWAAPQAGRPSRRNRGGGERGELEAHRWLEG